VVDLSAGAGTPAAGREKRAGRNVMMDWMGWGGHMGGFVLVFWVLSIAGMILVARFLTTPAARDQAPPADGAPTRSRDLEILEERFARGEIDREEFMQRKADLG
jgi:putative membrane protein